MDKDVGDHRMRLAYGDVQPSSPPGYVLNGQGNKSMYHEGQAGKKYHGNNNVPMNLRDLNRMSPPNYNVLHHQHQQQQHSNYSPPPTTAGLPPPPGLYNLNGNLPPPGLPPSPHLNQCNAPPGFFYPPVPPRQQQQQQQPHHLYNIPPGYSNHNSSALYSLQRPDLRPHQQLLPSSSSVQQPQNQFHFSSLFLPGQIPCTDLPGKSMAEDSSGLGLQQQQQHNSLRDNSSLGMNGDLGSSCSNLGNGGKNVIEPMIENIVGSMSMSTNGTYTHFGGPSVPMSPKFDGGNTTVTMSSTYPSSFAPAINSLQTNGVNVNFGALHQQNLNTPAGSTKSKKVLKESKVGIVQPKVIGKEPAVVTEKIQQRAVTPKDGVESRPQTPGKLSYSEVLAKSEAKGGGTTLQKTNSAPSSNSPSPGPTVSSRGSDSSSSFSGSGSTPAKNPHRRTSVSNCHPSDFYSEVAASNSSSSSSSPITKPKLTSVGSFEFSSKFKGKENNSNSSSKSSTTRNTPAGTPVHGGGGGAVKGGKAERKILSSSVSNNSQTPGTRSKSTGTGSAGKGAKSFQFEFDIEDLDDIQDKLLGKAGKRGSSAGNSASSPSAQPSKNSNSSSTPSSSSASANGNLTNSVEKKTGSSLSNGVKAGGRNGRDKNERNRSRKGGQNVMVRRVQVLTAVWLGHLISAVNWLWSLVLNVGTLSCSLAFTLMEDGYSWWKSNAIPSARTYYYDVRTKLRTLWQKFKSKIPWIQEEKSDTDPRYSKGTKDGEILSMMGPERNILLPACGEEALKRLLSVKGQDPYSILGVRSDSTDETIRRYYKKQAVLVHPDKNLVPGAEEAFKILARAFELVGEPAKRFEYHRQLLEAHQKERVFGEIGNLLEQLRKKMESVTNTIRCTKCNSRHNKVRTDRPLFAARYCAQCRINHAAREGDLWAERKGLFGFSRQYFACMDSSIWEVNEWASCQKKNLKHLQPDSHNVMYRLVAGGGGNNANSSSSKFSNKGQGESNGFRSNCDTPGGDDTGGSFEDPLEPEMDDWDTLINNLFRSSNIAGGGSVPPQHSKNSNNSSGSSTRATNSGSFSSSNSKFTGMGSNPTPATPAAGAAAGAGLGSSNNGMGSTANAATARRRVKVKRK